MGFFNWLGGVVCILLLFNAIGHVVYAHRLALGLNPVRSPELELERRHTELARRRTQALSDAYGLVSRGNRPGGFAELRQYLEQEEDPLDARIWFFTRMADWEDPGPALGFGADLIGRLVAARDLFGAHKVLLRCRHLDPGFAPAASDDQVLSQWLAAGRPTDLSAR